MSERERIQQQLIDTIQETRWPDSGMPTYTAPYGVLDDLKPIPGGGKVRTITFGIARHLDAQILIFRPDHIVIQAQGPLAPNLAGVYRCVDDVTAVLRSPTPTPRGDRQ